MDLLSFNRYFPDGMTDVKRFMLQIYLKLEDMRLYSSIHSSSIPSNNNITGFRFCVVTNTFDAWIHIQYLCLRWKIFCGFV